MDDGAQHALQHGRSLLPVGVTAIDGDFDRGDTIQVINSSGREIARGIANYSAVDLGRIRGRQSIEIETILGYTYGDEVIHRNDLVVL